MPRQPGVNTRPQVIPETDEPTGNAMRHVGGGCMDGKLYAGHEQCNWYPEKLIPTELTTQNVNSTLRGPWVPGHKRDVIK